MINLVLIIFNVPLVFCSRLDLNECDLPDSCDSSVSRCNNTDGSFTCQCLPGFEMNSSSVCVGELKSHLAAILIVILTDFLPPAQVVVNKQDSSFQN